MEARVKQALQDIVGADGFTDQIIDMVSYASDASEHRHRPDAAVWVTQTEQVSRILKLANQERFPVIPRGAGTGLTGLAVPVRGGLVIDLGQMNRILEVRIPDRYVVVQPGVVYADLENRLAPHGYMFPPDPASGKAATLGGNVATNAGGLRGAKYGTTRDYVLALEVVLPDGDILRTGTRTMKTASGFDLVRLFVGSEGTLGVVTEITLKINPKPPVTATCSAVFDDIRRAGDAVSAIMRSGIIPAVLEILDDECLHALIEYDRLDLPQAAAMVLAETDAYTDAENDFQIERILEIFRNHDARHVQRAESAGQVAKLWQGRKAVGASICRMAYNRVVEDITVPISRVAELLAATKEISRRHAIPIATLGHLGDGNLHPNILFDGRDPDQRRRAELVAGELFTLGIELGGTLTGEHGIGLAKAPFMTLEHSPVAMRVMRQIKHLFDPNDILNPGKMALDDEPPPPH